jgi:hypothetical protein
LALGNLPILREHEQPGSKSTSSQLFSFSLPAPFSQSANLPKFANGRRIWNPSSPDGGLGVGGHQIGLYSHLIEENEGREAPAACSIYTMSDQGGHIYTLYIVQSSVRFGYQLSD